MCTRSISGNWYLQTSDTAPYNLGTQGIHYVQPAGLVPLLANTVTGALKSVIGLVLG